jgi:hypothetical protein
VHERRGYNDITANDIPRKLKKKDIIGEKRIWVYVTGI